MPERMNKINHELKRILSEIILHELSHPDLQGYFYTVTQVKCSPDLHNAQVYVSVLGTCEQAKQGFTMLCRRLKAIQHLMASRVQMKYTPKLYLKMDDTALKAERINRILEQVHQDEEKSGHTHGLSADQ